MKNEKSRKTTSQPALVWVNSQLSPEHANLYLSEQRSEDEVLNGLLALVGSGYELAIKHDPGAQCWRAYLFNKLPDEPVHYGLSCFAATPRDTVNLLLFKFYIVMEGVWPDPESTLAAPKFG